MLRTLRRHAVSLTGAGARRYGRRSDVAESGITLFRTFNAARVPPDVIGDLRRTAADLAANRFTFLNRTREFPGEIDWDPPGEERLWRYNLHYADYVRTLALVYAHDGDPAALASLKRVVEAWIVANPVGRGVGWHAYPVALRIVNWLYALHLAGPSLRADRAFAGRLLASIEQQTTYLADFLEWDVGGNHLLENAKALVVSGLCLAGERARAWRAVGTEILWRQLEEQILADGAHYERSPMYHAIVLADCLEVISLLREAGDEPPAPVVERVRRMAEWLAAMRLPDGRIPLFQDSAYGVAPDVGDLLIAAAHVAGGSGPGPGAVPGLHSALLGAPACDQAVALQEPPQRHLRASGYVVCHAAPDATLVVDVGEIGPAHLPAHAHAGIFSFELGLGRHRVVVDSGVGTYEPGPWRDYYRSTRAHNTVAVGGANQSDVYGAFRAGRRARVRGVVTARLPWASVVLGQHDGYRHLSRGAIHSRCMALLDDGTLLVLDRLPTRRPAAVVSYVHFHPECAIALQGRQTADIACDSLKLRGWVVGDVSVTVLQGAHEPLEGWYAPEFGVARPTPTLVVAPHHPAVGWGIVLAPADRPRPEVSWTFTDQSCEFVIGAGAGRQAARVALGERT